MVNIRSRSRKHKRANRRKLRGGNAPLSHQLADGWSSKMSLGQGEDFFKYHEGQHGGALSGVPVNVLGTPLIDSSMQASAMQSGPMKAYQEIAGLSDQRGGKRRTRRGKKHNKRRGVTRSKGGKRNKRRGTRRSNKRSNKRSRGGALQFAPMNSRAMLLDNYNEAGLSSSWGKNVEFDMANARNAL
jgi:hypothetical protein